MHHIMDGTSENHVKDSSYEGHVMDECVVKKEPTDEENGDIGQCLPIEFEANETKRPFTVENSGIQNDITTVKNEKVLTSDGDVKEQPTDSKFNVACNSIDIYEPNIKSECETTTECCVDPLPGSSSQDEQQSSLLQVARTIPVEKFSTNEFSTKKQYECEVCFKKFNNSSTFKIHSRIHTGEKPFECDICSKKFTQLSSLNTHRRVHIGGRSYECHICMKNFSRSSDLNVHIRLHSGEVSFECNICNKKFTRSTHLKTHERSHRGEKPFECNICKKKFSRSSSLKEHEQLHNSEKLFKCLICMKKFINAPYLNKHIKRIHGEKHEILLGI